MIRTRFAPSPTGFMHVGGVRTALFAWLIAKQAGGAFVLRIEDTDKAREVEGSIEHIIESLKWLGIDWQEGPDIGGDFGPYVQSQRLESYKEWALKLLEEGYAYVDPYTPEEITAFREEAKQQNRPFLYRMHRPDQTSTYDGTRAIRFKTPDIKRMHWHDEVRGDLSSGEDSLDDIIILKADGYPTYNFAHIIDDHLMQITHIVRGEEFLASMPNYLALYSALGITLPTFVTVPPILAKEGGKKLSKRDGAKDILDYAKEDMLPEAVLNFLASLGWNDGTEQEVFSPEELRELFSINRIQKSGARFDEEKLSWLNWQHIKQLRESDPERLMSLIGERAQDISQTALALAMGKSNNLEMLRDQMSIFSTDHHLELAELDLTLVDKRLTLDQAKHYLEQGSSALETIDDFTAENIESALRAKMDELDAKPRQFLNLIRFVISGKQVSPGLFEMIAVLDKEQSLNRLKNAL